MPETITTLPVEDVYPHPKHYREVKVDAVKKLAASIAVAGQLEPIRVFKDGDIYIIDAGHHRHEAMKLLGKDTIEAIIVDADDAESTSATIMVASNMHFPETELERSRGTQLLLATGQRPIDVAALTGDNQDRMSKAARGMAIVADETACEDLTLDRLVAIADFGDDPEAVKSILTAAEAKWRGVADQIRRDRALVAAVATAEAIIAAAGVELLTTYPTDLRYLTRSDEVPEGATAARIEQVAWQGTAHIAWYGDAGATEESIEAAAAREKRDGEIAALEAAHEARLASIAQHYDFGALKQFAVDSWEGENDDSDITEVSVKKLEGPCCEVKGFTARVLCAILCAAETSAVRLLGRMQVDGWYATTFGAHPLAYLEALCAAGYELSEIETARLAEVNALRAGEAE